MNKSKWHAVKKSQQLVEYYRQIDVAQISINDKKFKDLAWCQSFADVSTFSGICRTSKPKIIFRQKKIL